LVVVSLSKNTPINFINIDLKPYFYNILPFFIKFENPLFLFKMVKTIFGPSTSSMEEHFTTIKDLKNHYYNIIMY
jgi:hypothetical protein